MKRQANWYRLDMLPTYLAMSLDQLQCSIEQLQNLKACNGRAHVLDDGVINRIIKAHAEQNESTWVFIEQCRQWRDQRPSKKQLVDIVQVEKTTKELEKTNNQVLILAKQIKHGTIDRILQKSDIELALDFLINGAEE